MNLELLPILIKEETIRVKKKKGVAVQVVTNYNTFWGVKSRYTRNKVINLFKFHTNDITEHSIHIHVSRDNRFCFSFNKEIINKSISLFEKLYQTIVNRKYVYINKNIEQVYNVLKAR